MTLEFQILIGVFITSTLSGILGMGGGMILMAIFGSILPVKLAMILHGITQLSANGSRAFIHFKEINWKLLYPYIVGSILVFVLFKLINFVPDKAMIFIFLGLFPFVSFLPKLAQLFNITRRFRPFICGVAVTVAQLLAGASGSILDIFFINSPLTRHQIVASKALTQTIGHLIKLIYYFLLLSHWEELTTLSPYLYISVIVMAYVGTRIGKILLDRLNEINFRKISRVVVFLIAFSLLYKGALLAISH